MGDEAPASEEWIVQTQATLGKLISKPRMTEKYLKKPPFRFLHDTVMEVSRTSNYAQGLYTTEESDAASLSDKAAKVDFLNKIISCVSFSLDEKVDVSANKIVAGMEPEKTNAFLQKLHQAATTCVGEKSDDAVRRVHSGESAAAPKKEKKKKEEEAPGPAAPPPAEGDDGAAAAAAAEEAAKKEADRARRKKREEEKKRKEEEAAAAAAAAEAEQQQAAAAEAAAAEAAAKKEEKRRREDKKRQAEEEEERRRQEEEANMAAAQAQGVPGWDQYGGPPPPGASAPGSAPGSQQGPRPDSMQGPNMDDPMAQEQFFAQQAAAAQGMEDPMGGMGMDRPQRMERPRTAGRKPPKVVSKVVTSNNEAAPGPVAAPLIIAEGTKDDDDEDMFEAPAGSQPMPGPQLRANDGKQHGKLVQDLLAEEQRVKDMERVRQEEEATREEVVDAQEDKGIKMGRLKRKKEQAAGYADIDVTKLGESIQHLCQAANPLGKSIDLVHQDINNMGKELDHWRQEYHDASGQYQKELKHTEEMLQPLYQKLAELEDKIAEEKKKIRNSRHRISKNDVKIQSLLESVVMAK